LSIEQPGVRKSPVHKTDAASDIKRTDLPARTREFGFVGVVLDLTCGCQIGMKEIGAQTVLLLNDAPIDIC
jgi:hypothetical protein